MAACESRCSPSCPCSCSRLQRPHPRTRAAERGVAVRQTPRLSSASIAGSGSFSAGTRMPVVMRGGSRDRSPVHAANGVEARGTAPGRAAPRVVRRSARSRSSGLLARAATRESGAASISAAVAPCASRCTRRLGSRERPTPLRSVGGGDPDAGSAWSWRIVWLEQRVNLKQPAQRCAHKEGHFAGMAGVDRE